MSRGRRRTLKGHKRSVGKVHWTHANNAVIRLCLVPKVSAQHQMRVMGCCITRHCITLVSLFRSNWRRRWSSDIVAVRMTPATVHDQIKSCSDLNWNTRGKFQDQKKLKKREKVEGKRKKTIPRKIFLKNSFLTNHHPPNKRKLVCGRTSQGVTLQRKIASNLIFLDPPSLRHTYRREGNFSAGCRVILDFHVSTKES